MKLEFRGAGTCRSCGAWQRKEQATDGWGRCRKAESKLEHPVRSKTLAYAMDEEGYLAGLLTHASFGCVQWEPQEGAEGE